MSTAQHAIHAVAIRKRSGKWMARQYAIKHNCLSAYRLAWQLESVK